MPIRIGDRGPRRLHGNGQAPAGIAGDRKRPDPDALFAVVAAHQEAATPPVEQADQHPVPPLPLVRHPEPARVPNDTLPRFGRRVGTEIVLSSDRAEASARLLVYEMDEHRQPRPRLRRAVPPQIVEQVPPLDADVLQFRLDREPPDGPLQRPGAGEHVRRRRRDLPSHNAAARPLDRRRVRPAATAFHPNLGSTEPAAVQSLEPWLTHAAAPSSQRTIWRSIRPPANSWPTILRCANAAAQSDSSQYLRTAAAPHEAAPVIGGWAARTSAARYSSPLMPCRRPRPPSKRLE